MRRAVSLVGAAIVCVAAAALLYSAEISTPAISQPTSITSSSKLSPRTDEQIAYINDFIHQGWQAHNLHPSPVATDGEWCRRLYLDLLGRIPSVDEVEQYTRDHSAEKKANLVNRLLSDEYVEEYAQNWSNLWTTVLIGRPPAGNDKGSLVDREGMQKYLRDSFARNKPYDQMVRELVTAEGANKPGDEKFHGETNFLIGNMDPDKKAGEKWINATAKTAKVFLGLQVQCTQCHNHPFNDWKQNQFWELNAFFRQTNARNEGPRKTREPLAELDSGNFPGEGEGPNRNPAEAVVFYELRNGQLKSALPVFVDGQEINPSGQLTVVNRRDELAKFITTSNYLNQAIVNRMWGHFMGYGFTKPVDDMGPHNPPSHPELLTKLADDFSNHSHDLKQLIRWIVLSEPYGLSSKVVKGRNEKDDPTKGEKPMFSHFYLRQMRPEELYESLLVATSADKTFRTSDEQEKMKTQWLRQFTITFGTDDGDDTTTFNGTIPQTLMMFNGEMMRRAISTEAGGFLDKIAKDPKMNDAAKINHLFMATLARKPEHSEIDWANKLLAARKFDSTSALQDVFWVVLNTGEFILNH
jgi:Protein of unknown function (DUF1549)/Protein of unknown function (DUF1553)